MAGLIILGVIGLVVVGTRKQTPSRFGQAGTTTTTVNNAGSVTDQFKNVSDLCNLLTKEQVAQLLGKTIVRTEGLTTSTLHSCRYYLNDTQALIINSDSLNVARQKQGHELMGRKIVVSAKIPMDNFLVMQEDGLINEIYLVLGPDRYVSINRSSGKAISEDEVVAFAAKLAQVVTGKIPLQPATDRAGSAVSSAGEQSGAPAAQENEVVYRFFSLIDAKRPSEAVAMMSVADASAQQAWAVQFNAISSVKVEAVTPALPETWQDNQHMYQVKLDVTVNPDSASAPIPYYGWSDGGNTRWLTLEKVNGEWKIGGIATGP